MKTLFKNIHILAIELLSLRTSPLIRIAAIVLLYAVAISFFVIYIQSIGSGTGIFSGLFQVTFISQGIENFFCLVDALILMPWSLTNSVNLCLEHLCSTEELAGLLVSSLIPVKPVDGKPSRRLTNLQKSQFSLSDELRQIIVGLLLGDANAQKQGVNARLRFGQGVVHLEYLMHLYELFKTYCSMEPKFSNSILDKSTRKIHRSIHFNTFSLPCFNPLYEDFYVDGSKVVPQNIGELLTPLGLSYWIADDGGFNKLYRAVVLSTQSFSLEEVKLLVNVLNKKFGLNCTINKKGAHFVIRIPSKSLPLLQALLAPHMPSMMRHKIDL